MKEIDSDSSEFHYYSEPTRKDFSVLSNKAKKKKNHSGRIGLLITLFDLAVIVVFTVFFMPHLLRRGAQSQWQGYEWTLKNQAFSGETLIALRVKATKQAQHTQQPFQVQFFADDTPITPVPMQAVLPDIQNENVVRLNVSALQGDRLRVVISIGTEKIELANSLAKDDS